MTVFELSEWLKQFPQDNEVVIYDERDGAFCMATSVRRIGGRWNKEILELDGQYVFEEGPGRVRVVAIE